MQSNERIVARLPITELWDDQGPLKLLRKRAVGRDDLGNLLRRGPVRFVVADCGQPLEWVSVHDCYRFWKDEVKPHLVERGSADGGFRLDVFPGAYCYVGAEWEGGPEPVVLLERHH